MSRELRLVRDGESIIVKDRNTAVATIVPYEAERKLAITPPRKRLRLPDLDVVTNIDPLSFLLEDRSQR